MYENILFSKCREFDKPAGLFINQTSFINKMRSVGTRHEVLRQKRSRTPNVRSQATLSTFKCKVDQSTHGIPAPLLTKLQFRMICWQSSGLTINPQ